MQRLCDVGAPEMTLIQRDCRKCIYRIFEIGTADISRTHPRQPIGVCDFGEQPTEPIRNRHYRGHSICHRCASKWSWRCGRRCGSVFAGCSAGNLHIVLRMKRLMTRIRCSWICAVRCPVRQQTHGAVGRFGDRAQGFAAICADRVWCALQKVHDKFQ